MSKLQYGKKEKGYDVEGARLKKIILQIPVTINSSGSYTCKFVFLTGYTCGAEDPYTEFSLGISIEKIEGATGYEHCYFVLPILTSSLLDFIENQTSPGVVSGIDPVNLTDANIATRINSQHIRGWNIYSSTWVNKHDKSATLLSMSGDEYTMYFYEYDSSNRQLTNKLKLIDCPNIVPQVKLTSDHVTYEGIFLKIYESIYDLP
jgi:hypothetical protein